MIKRCWFIILLLLLNTQIFSVSPPKKPASWDSWQYHEKIRWRALHLDPRIPYVPLVDKIQVKEVVRGEMKTAQTFFITDDPSQIFMEELPSSFVMKSNNASSRGILVKNGIVLATKKRESDFQPTVCTNEFLRSYAEKWLNTPYAANHEKQYALIHSMILFEEYIEDITTEIELYCFNGKVRMIGLFFSSGYTNNPEISYYDANWNLFDVVHPLFSMRTNVIEKPDYIDPLIAFAERFTKKIDHVRIDFFVKGEDIYLGEFTFTTAGGCKLDHLNAMLSEYWDFPSSKRSYVNHHLNNALKRANWLNSNRRK